MEAGIPNCLMVMLTFALVAATVALFFATRHQAKATEAMMKLQEKLTSAETNPMILLRIVWSPWKLEICNLGKFGVMLLEIRESHSIATTLGGSLLPKNALPKAIPPSHTEGVDLYLPTAPQSPLQGQHQLEVHFKYGGQPTVIFRQIYTLERDPQTSGYRLQLHSESSYGP